MLSTMTSEDLENLLISDYPLLLILGSATILCLKHSYFLIKHMHYNLYERRHFYQY